jgi:hypothetical protein
VGGTLLYILSFALGAGPVTGLIIPELNNAQIRGMMHQLLEPQLQQDIVSPRLCSAKPGSPLKHYHLLLPLQGVPLLLP